MGEKTKINWTLLHYRLTFASLIFLSIGIFLGVAILSLAHIFLFLPSLYFIVKHIARIEWKSIQWSVYFMAMICLSIIFSVFFNWNEMERPQVNLSKIKHFLLPLLSIFAYKETFQHYLSQRKISFLIHLFIISTTLATLSGLIGLYSGFNPLKMQGPCHPIRACGMYGTTITYGYGISLFMVLITGAILYRKRFQQYIDIKVLSFAWIINLIGLFFSFARGGWLSFLLAVPFFFFKENKKKFLSAMGLGFIILLTLFVFSSSTRKMFLERTGSNRGRIVFFKAAYKAFQEKPFWGWGYRNFEANVMDINERYSIGFLRKAGHAHNNFLEHLASTGGFGLIALVLWSLAWFLESFKGKGIITTLSFPFVVCFLVSGLTQYTFGDSENLFLILNIWVFGQLQRQGQEDFL